PGGADLGQGRGARRARAVDRAAAQRAAQFLGSRPMPKAARRIAKITLDERTVIRRNADIEHDRAIAISDLLEENSFVPASGIEGPFHLHLAIAENRL